MGRHPHNPAFGLPTGNSPGGSQPCSHLPGLGQGTTTVRSWGLVAGAVSPAVLTLLDITSSQKKQPLLPDKADLKISD